MLPAILRAQDEDQQGGRLKRQPSGGAGGGSWMRFQARGDGGNEDFARWKPQLVLVERCQDPVVQCQVLEDRHDDLLGWFLRDAGFRAEFAGYRYWKSVGSFDAYVAK